MIPDPAKVRVSVQFGEDDNLVIRLGGRSRPILARCLGVDRATDGRVERIFLDRKIHQPNQWYAGDWSMRGAVSTILEPLPGAVDATLQPEVRL